MNQRLSSTATRTATTTTRTGLARRRALTAVALGLALTAGAACGGSSTPSAAKDEAAAERMLLKLEDLPGYTVDTDDGGDDSNEIDKCVKDNPTWTADPRPRSASSDDFTKDDGNIRVSSGSLLTVKVPEAQKAMVDMREAIAGDCIEQVMKDGFTEGAGSGSSVRSIGSAPLPGPTYGDESMASRTTMAVTAGGERATLYFDFLFMRSDRAISGMFLLQIGSPLPETERARLAGLVESRMTGKPARSVEASPATTEAPATTAAPATTVAPTGRSAWTRYSDPSGISFEHAPAWTVRPGSSTAPLAVIMDPATGVPFRRNVNILVQTPSSPVTLDALTAINLKEVEGFQGYSKTSAGPTTLSGAPAHRLSYRATLEGTELRFLAVWTVVKNKVYTVTYTSDPDRFIAGMGDAERLISSIRLPAGA